MGREHAIVNRAAGLQGGVAEEFTALAGDATAPVTVARIGASPTEAQRILLVLALRVRHGEQIVIESEDEETLHKLVALVTSEDEKESTEPPEAISDM